MLHGEEAFLKVSTIYGRGGHLGHLTLTIYINFRSPFPRRLSMNFSFDWPSEFREDVWNCGRRRMTDDDDCSGELINKNNAKL